MEQIKITETAYTVEFTCPCSASMSGNPHKGQIWTCGKNHAYRVLKDGFDVEAESIVGDPAAGITKNAVYGWSGKRPSGSLGQKR
jgi:alpha-tubulin suppressor-like RCC1 family protein